MSASRIGNMEKGNEKVKKRGRKNTAVLELKAALIKSQKWKSPGMDKVPDFWWNGLWSSHVTFTSLLNKIRQNRAKTPEWMWGGTTFLLSKSNDTKDPKSYRPITFFKHAFQQLQTSNISSDRYDIFKTKNTFYNKLNMKGVSDQDYEYVQQV